jgi:hypothetical protein
MPHYKCDACRVRLHTSGKRTDRAGEPCPECDSPLEPVADLTQLVGFRSITPRDDAPAVDAGLRWLDDDEPQAGAVALPPPDTYT